MGGPLPESGDANVDPVKSSSKAADLLMTAMTEAAATLGETEVSQGLSAAQVLADPGARQAAVRWRAGPVHRRLTALLARLRQGLGQVFPGMAATPAGEVPLSHVAPVEPSSWWTTCRSTVSMLMSWRTLVMLLAFGAFPRLIAFVIAMSVRLVARLLLLAAGRVFKELFMQIALLIAELESQLIEWLYNAWMEAQPATEQPRVAPTMISSTPLATSTPQAPLPARWTSSRCFCCFSRRFAASPVGGVG